MTSASTVYGQSLYELAKEEGISEEILQEMQTVGTLLKENPKYITLLLEPSIRKKQRLALLDEAFGGQVHQYLLNFLKILVENGVLRSFSSELTAFRELYNRDHGIEQARVTSAVPLSEDQLDALTARLQAMSGKTIELVTKVDPSLIGGMRVELEGKLYDGSVSGRLTELRRKVDQIVL